MTRVWREDLTAVSYGRLTVISEADRVNGRRQWRCHCSCGEVVFVEHRSLKRGSTQSCGCLRRESTSKNMEIHGQAKRGEKTRAYKIWLGMLARCITSSATGFERYGGAGVSVCERWSKFDQFFSDMGDPPVGFSIDRIDSSKGYEPSNCRWATRQQQNENRSSVRWIEFGGKRMNVVQWAAHLGIAKSTLLEALKKHPVEVALRDRNQ